MTASNEFLSLRRVLGDLTTLVSTQSRVPEPGSVEYWASAQTEDFAPLARTLLGPKSARGQILAVSDPSGECGPRHFAAVQLARLLNASGLTVLLVDAELDAVGFSRGLAEPEAEGFLDLVHYGSSPSATVQATPIAGIAALSAGSFRPLPEDELERGALTRALAQLRSHYDWILIVLPALRSGSNYHELLAHADAVVLASAASEGRGARLGRLADYLRGQNVPLRGAILFTPKTPDEAPPQRATAPASEPTRSSPVFRWTLGALTVVLLGFVGWWATAQLRRPEAPAATESATQAAPPLHEIAASMPDPSFAEVLPAVPGDSLRTQSEPSIATPDDAPAVESPAPVRSEPKPRPGATEPTTPASGLERDLTRAPADCWSLHLWSFPDSMEAELASRGLRAEGLAPRTLAVNLPERGRWYRVVVGCFDRRGDALAARGLMASWPGVENVGIVRVP